MAEALVRTVLVGLFVFALKEGKVVVSSLHLCVKPVGVQGEGRVRVAWELQEAWDEDNRKA